jgi:transposase-like protein
MTDLPINLSTLAKEFSDEDAAYRLVEAIRWPHGPVCPHCGVVDRAYFLQPKDDGRKTRHGTTTIRRVWKCKDCRKQFSVLVGTVFQGSHISLSKWLLATYMLCSNKNGMAANELYRTLGVSLKTAWYMTHRIRYAMTQPALAGKLLGVVEADETYVGGRRPGKRGRGAAGKTPVVTLVERGGEARSRVMQPVTGANVGAFLQEQVLPDAVLMTDSYGIYTKPGKDFAEHHTVNHGEGEYVRGAAHVNSAEGFFSQLKRSIDGTHHHVSAQHLHRYVSEFDYRYSTRKMNDGERTQQAIRMSVGKRLRYRAKDTTTGAD